MAPNAVSCSLCGGKFFKASLAHHQKVCLEKIGKQCHECAYCHNLWPMLEMDDHIRTCEVALAAGARPTGASSALAKRLKNHRARSAAGNPDKNGNHLGGSGMCDVSEFGDDGDSRIPCQCCGRKFTMDRIGKHQAVCQKVSTKKTPKAKLFHVVGPGKARPPATSNWRKSSEGLRQACRAGRGVVDPVQSDAHCDQSAWTPEVAPGHSPSQKTPIFCNPATMLIEEKFNMLDANNDGVLSREEMDSFLKSMDRYASSTKLDLAFADIDKDGDGFVDLKEFSACILGGMGTTKKAAAGSPLDHIRRKGAPKAETPQNAKRVPETPQMPKSKEFRRRPRSASLTSPTHPGAKTRRRSAGAVRSAEPLPAWGSAEASWGRQCITSASDTGKCARTPHNTSWGGCSTVPVTEKEGMESNRCSPGNPFDRSWLYEKSTVQPSFSPASPPQAPVLLGHISCSQPSPTPCKTFTPTKPSFQARSGSAPYCPRRRNTQKLQVHFE